MHKHMLWCSLALLPVMFLGCSKSGNGTTDPPPPPPGVAEVEPNDVDPQYLGALGTADIRVNGGMGPRTCMRRSTGSGVISTSDWRTGMASC
jgi:hypothetical protein